MIVKDGHNHHSTTFKPGNTGKMKFNYSVSLDVLFNIDNPSKFHYKFLTAGERAAFRDANGTCGICNLPIKRAKDRVLDHCHYCDIAHGVLCQWCNLGKPMLYLHGEKILGNRDEMINRIWKSGVYDNLTQDYLNDSPANWHMTKDAIEAWNMQCGCPPEVEVHYALKKFISRLGYCEGILCQYSCALAKIAVNVENASGDKDVKQLPRYPFTIVSAVTGELLGTHETFRKLELGLADAIKQAEPAKYNARMAMIASGQYSYKPDIPYGIEAFVGG
jgi:Recombination endonuclease VII